MAGQQERAPGRPRALRMCGVNRVRGEGVWSESLTGHIREQWESEISTLSPLLTTTQASVRVEDSSLALSLRCVLLPSWNPPAGLRDMGSRCRGACPGTWPLHSRASTDSTVSRSHCRPMWPKALRIHSIPVLRVNWTRNREVSQDSHVTEWPRRQRVTESYSFSLQNTFPDVFPSLHPCSLKLPPPTHKNCGVMKTSVGVQGPSWSVFPVGRGAPRATPALAHRLHARSAPCSLPVQCTLCCPTSSHSPLPLLECPLTPSLLDQLHWASSSPHVSLISG